MEQRDFLMREIEKIGKMLLAIIGRLKKAVKADYFEQEIEMIDTDIISITGISLKELLRLPEDELLLTLEKTESFDDANLELFADMLTEISSGLDKKESRETIMKSIRILEMIDSRSRTYSFERQSKLESLRGSL